LVIMGRAGNRSKKSNKNSTAELNIGKTLDKRTSEPHNKKRSVLKDLLFGLIVCLIFFAAIEGVLRLTGFSIPPASDDSFVGFSGIKPLFTVTDGIANVSKEKLRFFNPSSFKANKPRGVFRVFTFGGSSTYGHPFDGRTSFSRWLKDLLVAAFPDRDFEVINAGGISYASYRIVPLMRETLSFQPDLFVVYTGHNEFLETRTYSGLMRQGRVLLNVRTMLERLRVYQAIQAAMNPFLKMFASELPEKKEVGDASSLKGRTSNKPILKDEVSAILDRSAGLELYHRDEAFAKAVAEHFNQNLRIMVELAEKHSVPIIFVDPPSNIKDFSPFKSEFSASTKPPERKEITENLTKGYRRLDEGNPQAALELVGPIVQLDPLYAETRFLRGRALLALGRYPEAREEFILAKDLDICPLRCTSSIRNQILAVAKDLNVSLVPFQAFIERRATQLADMIGIPGNESFMDHVHPTIELHQILADLILDKMCDLGLVPKQSLTTERKKEVFSKGIDGLDPSFMATKDLNLAKTLRWAGKKQEAFEALQRVVSVMDGNPEVHKMLGAYYLEDNKHEKAIEEYTQAVRLSNYDPQLEFSLAVAYYRSGKVSEAVKLYEKLAATKDSLPEVYGNLAMIYLEQGNPAKSKDVIEDGTTRFPNAPELFAPSSLANALTGNIARALPLMLKAIEYEPGNAGLYYNLAGMYALEGHYDKALDALDSAVSKGYNNLSKLMNDPVFNNLRSLPRFKSIVEGAD
jgi:Flp pilus assembly protein TadD